MTNSRQDAVRFSGLSRNIAILGLVFAVALAVLLWRLKRLIDSGGGPFAQGDWLINLESGVVRRGILGDLFLRVSDATGIGLLQLVGTVQAVLIVSVVCSIFYAALLARLPDRLLLILVSPLLVTFWVIDTVGAFRKELLGFLAFLPLLLPRGTGAAWLVPGLFAVAVAGHEGNAFFAPALCVAVMARFPKQGEAWRRLALNASILAVAAVGFAFAIMVRTVPDTTAMCAALTVRGLPPEICAGAIDWMDDPPGAARASFHNLLTRYSQSGAVLAFAALLAPVFIAFRHAPRSAIWLASGAVVFAGFLPLYVFAVDWGRWMSMLMFSVAFITMILAIQTEAGWLRRPVPPALFLPVLVLAGSLGVYHYGGLPVPGFVPVLADIAARKLFGVGLLP